MKNRREHFSSIEHRRQKKKKKKGRLLVAEVGDFKIVFF